jgi:RNA polymerase sigma factor (TIGR02999 family)
VESGEITSLLEEVRNGDAQAFATLIPLVYSEMRRLAAYFLERQRPDHTLQPTALVHEVYLRLVGRTSPDCRDREHFFNSAAQIMRNLLVDYARATQRFKRGGGTRVLSLDEASVFAAVDAEELLVLHQALSRLSEFDPRAAKVVELRHFVGLDVPETATALQVSERTVKRDWTSATAWLRAELRSEPKTSI